MSIDAIFTLVTVGLLIAALVSNRIGPDTAMLGALTLLLAAGILTPKEAAAGFADPSVLMIAALFVIATGLTETGAMEMVARWVMGRPKTITGAQFRLMGPVAGMSAVMNNTPIVAMYLPIVHDWARRLRVSPSRLYMPLSFAAILGGACTLIGTSTNLAINQLYLDYLASNAGELHRQFGLDEPSHAEQFWRITAVGVPVAIVGIGFILAASRVLLPERIAPDADIQGGREYTVELMVERHSPIVGKSIEQAGLRQLPGLFLSEIQRDGEVFPAVGPGEVIQAGDRLVFVGVVDSVVDLLKIRGLVPATDQVGKVDRNGQRRRMVEAVVSHASPLVRKSIRQSQFRTRYNAAVIAVHRGGERVRGKIGDIVLQPGDTLLLATHAGFTEAFRNSGDFYLVSDVDTAKDIRHERAWVALAILGLLVVLLTVPGATMPPVAAGFLCAILMVFTRCCTGTQARNNINWQVLLVIGAALGIGRAMTETGAAQSIADAIFAAIGGVGPHGLLVVFFLLTNAFAQLVTNKGSAVLMFPIGMAIAHDAGLSPEPFVVTLMVAAACSFATPVGFVTNLMVYGPGGYRFLDYARLGVPLTLIVGAITAALAPAIYPF